ncbi:C40 family peptidase [bacterium]|nr:C40 family peptidase [bacterium]MBU1958112.1 C40 family peptidase [bacterium]
MKKIKLLKLTLLSSVMFLTACSTTEPKVNKVSVNQKISVYNIMGITEPKKEIVHFTIKEDTLNSHEAAVLDDIEFISYQSSRPSYAQFNVNTINEIEWNAKSFLGTPYVWGATGPSTFDCSGFTQWVYRDVGINIPRVSRDQARVGQYVRYENLQRGDMVFFDTKKQRTGIVSHVGIYLGRGNFIHASSSGRKVVIYNFNKQEFYKERFLWGRRLISTNRHYASN